MTAKATRNWRRLRANVRARHDPCGICGQLIDYLLPADQVDAFSVDHIKPRSTHPELAEDPANLQAAHARCNKSRGARDLRPALGVPSREW